MVRTNRMVLTGLAVLFLLSNGCKSGQEGNYIKENGRHYYVYMGEDGEEHRYRVRAEMTPSGIKYIPYYFGGVYWDSPDGIEETSRHRK
ncbi:MAG: hypothetical protein Q8P57_04670 [Candidatus Pacearchaeota archaeon]|nr:hypothetical protein [Candidatus Pacearchaeota archaeon]